MEYETEPKPDINRKRDGSVEINITCESRNVRFAFPPFGPGTYRNVGAEILNRGLRLPTAEETASLMHVAYCAELSEGQIWQIEAQRKAIIQRQLDLFFRPEQIPLVRTGVVIAADTSDLEIKLNQLKEQLNNEPELKYIRETVMPKTLFVFNRNLWTDKGVYVIPDPEAKGLSEKFDESELEEKLKNSLFHWRSNKIDGITFSRNKQIRFAPKETYRTGEYRSSGEDFTSNGFIVATFYREGTDKLLRISHEFKSITTIIYTPEVHNVAGKDNVSTIPCLSGDITDSLKISGKGTDETTGYALGVLK